MLSFILRKIKFTQSSLKTNCHGLYLIRALSTSNQLVENEAKEVPMEFSGHWPNDVKLAFLKDVKVIEDFVTAEEEASVIDEIEPYLKRMRYERDHWDDAIQGFRETERKSWFPKNREVLNKIIQRSFPNSPTLPHIHVLDLEPDGVIKPHVDSVRYCGNTISGISLLTDSIMRFVQSTVDPYKASDDYRNQPKESNLDLYSCKVLLRRRSLYIMSHSSRYNFTHEILKNEESFINGEQIVKGRRISIICRNEPEKMNNDDLKSYSVERAKQGRAKCKKCKNSCEKGELRVAKVMPNGPFGEGPMSLWYHLDCFAEVKKNPRSNLKSLQSSNEISGFDLLEEDDQKLIIRKLGIIKKAPIAPSTSKLVSPTKAINSDDNLFQNFVILVQKVANEPSYNSKSSIIKQYITKGTSKKRFEGHLETWLTLLMPHIDSRVYNLKDKQIVKLFSRIFGLKQDDLLQDLYSGDVSETIAKFFPLSRTIKPVQESDLTVFDVNKLLDELSKSGMEDAQTNLLELICKRCTASSLKTIVRLIIRDLKMNCRERHVLDALHEDAYNAFQKSRDLKIILKQFCGGAGEGSSSKSSGLTVMTAISPMLAEACKDFDKALKKCPKGFYSEIKYDGERVQIHKRGTEFKFFSRNLKPVQEHKIAKLKTYLPKAFPSATDLILDSEIIMVDSKTGDILPFGSLGKHKKEEHSNAVACFFIFDCLYYNGDDLTSKTLTERKKFLESNLQPIKHHIELSEYRLLTKKNELVDMTKEVLRKGLEGLVLKGIDTIYEPGKRRWLKVKKDYLLQGSIADTADLVILGCYYGSGKLGNYYSIFLVGCYDEINKVWKTVTKVHSGLTDAEVERMHKRLKPLVDDWSTNKALPPWVQIDRSLIPNVIAKDPSKMPVLEVMAAEFTDSDVHTANSISMRFPRIVKIRDDKSPKEATTLKELTHLYEESKSGMNIDELNKLKSNSESFQLNDNTPASPAIEKKSKAVKRKSSDNDDEISRDDEGETSVKKKKKVEDEIDSKEVIFKEFLLLNASNLTDDDIKCFKELGGKTTENSKEANLVLHDDKEFNESLDSLREKYTPRCRHYQKSWLTECFAKNTLVNPIQYIVVLRQA